MYMRALPFWSAAAASGVTDADATAYFAAADANGGTVSPSRQAVIRGFILAEKAAGTWALTDDYWVFWAESAFQALVSLKQLRLAVVVATPTFTIDRGYQCNGTDNGINTGFIPGTHCIVGAGTSQRCAVYERTNQNSNTYSIGCITSSTAKFVLRARNSTTMDGGLNSTTFATYTLSPNSSAGYSATSRASGGTTEKGYKNGVAMADVTGLTVGVSLPTHAVHLGCLNNAGVIGSFRASMLGLACIGGPLSDAQELAQYTNVQAWATAVGANV